MTPECYHFPRTFDVEVHAEDLLVGEMGAALALDRAAVLSDPGI
jgi:hypothetical protein